MKWLKLTSKQFQKSRKAFIQFFRKHGDRRITKEGIQWIEKMPPEKLDTEGTIIICAINQNKLIGVLIISDYGIEESFMAVHKYNRNQDIANQMVQIAIQDLGKVYGRVAMDNIPSLKVCFENGLVAFHLFEGPTGKPTLWLGGGNWRKEDVL